MSSKNVLRVKRFPPPLICPYCGDHVNRDFIFVHVDKCGGAAQHQLSVDFPPAGSDKSSSEMSAIIKAAYELGQATPPNNRVNTDRATAPNTGINPTAQ